MNANFEFMVSLFYEIQKKNRFFLTISQHYKTNIFLSPLKIIN